MAETIAALSRVPDAAQVTRGPAHSCELPDSSVDAIVTDPPYYDNVPYADLSDFFYVWLKRSIGFLYPDHFASLLMPKKQEAYVSAARHGGDRSAAMSTYRTIIQRSLDEAHRILKPSAPLVLVYAHKTTAGWSSIVDALRAANFMVTEAWPISTESRGRVRAQNSAVLASSIFIVARKRVTSAIGNYTRDVLPELTAIVQERVRTLSTASITGADLVVATVGAGLRAYTRYARVEMDNGAELDASTFLTEVQRSALATILEYVVGLNQSSVSTVDKVSQYYVLARYQYGAAEIDFDKALVLDRGIGVELDGPGSITSGALPLVMKIKKVVQLQDYQRRGAAHHLGGGVDSAAPLIDVLHRLLWLNEHQPSKIPAFLAQAQPDVISLRMVAEALAGKGLAAEPTPGMARDERSEEQRAIGRLLPVWRRVVEDQFTRNLLAADSLLGARGRYHLSHDQVEDLKDRVKRLTSEIDNTLKRLYDLVALPLEAQGAADPLRLEWFDLRSLPLSGERIQERMLEALRNWVFSSVTPSKLVGLTRLGSDDATQTLSCAKLVEWCFSFLTFPKLLGTDPLRAAIVQGVRDGLFGYSAALQFDASSQAFVTDHRLAKIGVPLSIVEIDLGSTSYIIAPALAQRLAQPPASTMPEPVAYAEPSQPDKNGKEEQEAYQTDGETRTPASIIQTSGASSAFSRGRRYCLHFTANKHQLFRAFKPLQNLAEKTGQFEVTITVVAQSDTPLEANWLRNAVEEPLDEADVVFDRTLEE
ncbi:MAG: hypothetical protein MI924_17360 [Chloroflexales bacterium]|nr:hypothetical protein [Chloroflexales bacterium]